MQTLVGDLVTREALDSVTGNCGVSPPTLFMRIGSMVVIGQPSPSSLHAARRGRDRHSDLAHGPSNPCAGPAVQAGPPEKTTTLAFVMAASSTRLPASTTPTRHRAWTGYTPGSPAWRTFGEGRAGTSTPRRDRSIGPERLRCSKHLSPCWSGPMRARASPIVRH